MRPKVFTARPVPPFFTLGDEGLSIEAFIAQVKSEHYASRIEAIEQAVLP